LKIAYFNALPKKRASTNALKIIGYFKRPRKQTQTLTKDESQESMGDNFLFDLKNDI
jgi:hypothetical protein